MENTATRSQSAGGRTSKKRSPRKTTARSVKTRGVKTRGVKTRGVKTRGVQTRSVKKRKSSFKTKKIKASDLDWAGMAQQLLNVRTFIDLKKELTDVGNQLKKIDVTASLSPSAQKKLTQLYQRYKQVITQLAQTQKTFDRDFDRVLRKLQASKKEATKRLQSIKKASKNIKKSFAK